MEIEEAIEILKPKLSALDKFETNWIDKLPDTATKIALLEAQDQNYKSTKEALGTLFSLAEDYLKWSGSGIVPEEKELKYQSVMEVAEKKLTDTKIENENRMGFNQARHEVLVRLAGLEERLQGIVNFGLIKKHTPERIAQAIIEMLRGGSDE